MYKLLEVATFKRMAKKKKKMMKKNKGMHKMPNGNMMSDKEMKKMEKKLGVVS